MRNTIDRFSKYVRVVLVDTREIVNQIADEDVRDFLQFRTGLAAGESKIHIVNLSAFEVETERHTIERGETLCHKYGQVTRVNELQYGATCPGCLAIGKGIAVRDLTDEQLLQVIR